MFSSLVVANRGGFETTEFADVSSEISIFELGGHREPPEFADVSSGISVFEPLQFTAGFCSLRIGYRNQKIDILVGSRAYPGTEVYLIDHGGCGLRCNDETFRILIRMTFRILVRTVLDLELEPDRSRWLRNHRI